MIETIYLVFSSPTEKKHLNQFNLIQYIHGSFFKKSQKYTKYWKMTWMKTRPDTNIGRGKLYSTTTQNQITITSKTTQTPTLCVDLAY